MNGRNHVRYALTVTVMLLAIQHISCQGGIPAFSVPSYSRQVAKMAKDDNLNPSNIIRVATWNINRQPVSNSVIRFRRPTQLCRSVLRMGATFFMLQDVSLSQLRELKQCLRAHVLLQDDDTQNVIGFRRSSRLQANESKTIYLSDTPNIPLSKLDGTSKLATCTWAKLSYAKVVAVKEVEKETIYSRLLGYLRRFSRLEKGPRVKMIRRKQKIYSSFNFFAVSVANLDENNEDIAARQMEICLEQLYEVAMERRRYPVILGGSFNWEKDSKVVDVIDNNEYYSFENGIEDSKQSNPRATREDKLEGTKKLTDHIFYDQFKGLMTGVIVDARDEARKTQINRPLLSYLVPASRE